jgi:hypothetical protein
MVLLLQNPLLPKSSAFSAMPMISTTILQPPTNGLSTVKLLHASIVVETMDSIVVMSLVIRIALHRTRLSLKKRETVLQGVVAMVEDVLVVVGIIRDEAIMNGTSLESPILPVIMGFSVLMEFGWPFVASVKPGVAPQMPILLAFMMLLFWLDPTTASLALIRSITIVLPLLPPTQLAMELQHLLLIPQLQFQGEKLL